MIPEAMQGATEFEIYCWVHQCNRTIGQIRQYTGKTTQDIRAAIDKGCRLRWGYIPKEELPEAPCDGMSLLPVSMAAPPPKQLSQVRKHNRKRIADEKVREIEKLLHEGYPINAIRRAVHASYATVYGVAKGVYKK